MTKTKSKTESTTPPELKTYILNLRNGDTRKVSVPATWTLTFGPTIPYAGKNTGVSNGTALRFYEGSGKDKLRACFTDVEAFRDSALPIQERRTTIQRQTVQKAARGGMRNMDVEARVTEWVNPDEVDDESDKPNEFLSMIEGSKATSSTY